MEILNDKIIKIEDYLNYIESHYDYNASISQRVSFLDYYIDILASNTTRKFSSSFAEMELNKISSSLEFNISDKFIKGSILHIVTESYHTGGHTKLLELFIENSSSYFQKQSVMLTKQKVDVPSSLEKIIEKFAELIVIENCSMIDKAIEVASIASNYEYIVLHLHPNDIMANLAFANKAFTRPIIYLNHADHIFWCGVSVSDLVLDISSEGSQFSTEIRGVKNSQILPIPLKPTILNMSKGDARDYLNLDNDKKIILSIASEYKYGTTKKDIYNFINMAIAIVDKINNSMFLIIGPSSNSLHWDQASTLSKGKIKLLGIQDRELLPYYITSTDLYIESFPFASYTALLEIIAYSVPILTLKTPVFTLDTIKNSSVICATISELITKSIYILENSNIEKYDIGISNHLPNEWLDKMKYIFENHLVKQHQIQSFTDAQASVPYINHISKIVNNQDMIFSSKYHKIAFKLKFKTISYMKKNNLITLLQFLNLVRKTIKVALYENISFNIKINQKKYISITMLSTLVPLFISTTILLKLDAYSILNPDEEKFYKTPNQRIKVVDYIADNHNKYNTYIFGSSRVGNLNPLLLTNKKAYNMTYSEGLPHEHLLILKFFIKNNINIKHLIIGLDDFSYQVSYNKHLNQYATRSHYLVTQETKIDFYKYFFLHYLTLNDLDTIIKKYVLRETIDAKMSNEIFNTIYHQKKLYSTYKIPKVDINNPTFLKSMEYKGNEVKNTLNDIREIVKICSENKIELKLFINPIHQTTYKATDQKQFALFRDELSKITAYYDFSYPSYVTTNNIYWLNDTSHYNMDIGKIILEKIYNKSDLNDGFGIYVEKKEKN